MQLFINKSNLILLIIFVMKYTFEKFQIQLVSKPNSPFNKQCNKNSKFSVGFQTLSTEKIRNIQTTDQTGRKKIQKHPSNIRKSVQKQVRFQRQTNDCMTRSQSLKSQNTDRYKNWLNQSTIANSLKQKQYRVFKQKCMDLLTKKKSSSQNQKKTQNNQRNNKQRVFFGHNQPQLIEQSHQSVEQMMNNIIQKFKSNSRKNNKIQRALSVNKGKSQINPQKEPFFTINNQFHENNNFNKNHQERIQSYKSAEMRKNSNNLRNKSHCMFRRLKADIEAHQFYQSERKSNQNTIEMKGINMYKLLDPNLNLLTCTSLSLNSTSRQIGKPTLIDHINLSPCQIVARSSSSYSKRKKINLNKPLIARKVMKFTKNSSDEQYNKKIKSYLDFLFKINFSNQIYISLQLTALDDTISFNNSKYKVYVGPGNNSLLIKSLLKRREWIQVVDNMKDKEIQFYWTQNKINQLHEKQSLSAITSQSIRVKSSSSKKSSVKIASEVKELNVKLLPLNKCEQVENFIFGEGFQVPFDKEYEVKTVTNHLPNNNVIGSKKNLFKSMFSYYTNVIKKDPFTVIPKTYHIRSSEDPQYKRFIKQNNKEPNKLWIIKPGQNTNRGNGIRLSPFSKIQAMIKQKIRHPNGQLMTYIIQSYINRPFLYNGRKFDIRHYMLITSVNGLIKVYWYRDGYIRTSSEIYDIEDHENQFIHLTNDAIQQKSQSYGQYEDANKLSYSEFQRYLDYSFPGKGYNFQNIIKEMRQIMTDVIKANYLSLDKDRRRDNFQLFGLDFMIDRDFKPYLIQINFNPCLVVNCNILSRIIPPLIQNTLRIGLDPLFPPKSHLPVNKRHTLSENYLKNLRYELIFDQASLKNDIFHNPQLDDSQNQEEQQYGDNGKQLPQNFTF